jgi:hypothetical protein
MGKKEKQKKKKRHKRVAESTIPVFPSVTPIEAAPEITAPDSSLNSNKQTPTEQMEVHHHSHASHGKKKWTHYFWEFLMLFLAVFCGFLAENIREHKIEHQREKQYMQSMVEDLMNDTAEYNNKLWYFDTVLVQLLDTSMEIIYNRDIASPAVVRELYKVVPRCSQFVDLNIEDRTMSQLKNSGNLRLIRNKAVTDSLAVYWKVLNSLNNTVLPGYEKVRTEVKNGLSPLLLSADKKQFIKLANYISNLRTQIGGPIKGGINDAREKANSLINLIKKEYHLE